MTPMKTSVIGPGRLRMPCSTYITVPSGGLIDGWPDAEQATRALQSLVADGLVVSTGDGYRL